VNQGSKYNPNTSQQLLRVPRAPKSFNDVVGYNISYLYIAGLRTDEAAIPKAVPLFGDETNGNDTGTASWYGNGQDKEPGVITRGRGYFAKDDNHAEAGGNYVFNDGHAEFIKDNIHFKFFEGDNCIINVTDKNRSSKVQTID
jgi:prepilin-type processing-associated H-X9-DG protein